MQRQNRRTDLAEECLQEGTLPSGVQVQKQILGRAELQVVEIRSREAAEQIGKPCGVYITLTLPPLWDEKQPTADLAEVVAEGLRSLLPPNGAVLVVGLGNREITPDALGPLTAEQIFVTRCMGSLFPSFRTVASLAPNVLGKTGLEAMETVRAVVEEVQPAALIVVDALATADLERVGRTVQMTDSGIAPGSGVQNSRQPLNREELNIPVIALGIPTVVDLSAIYSADHQQEETMMTTPRQVDLLIRRGAAFLAAVINRALHPSLSLEELLLLQR